MYKGMKRSLPLFILMLLSWSCSNKEKISVQGTLEGGTMDTKIFLEEQLVSESLPVDSAELSSGGGFRMHVKSTEPRFYNLKYSNNNPITLLLEPGEKVVITANIESFSTSYTVAGSPGSRLIRDIHSRHHTAAAKLDSLVKLYNELKEKPDFKTAETDLNAKYIATRDEHRKYVIGFIITHYSSMASIVALYLKYGDNDYVLNSERDLQYFKIVSDSLSACYPKSKQVRAVKANFNAMMSTRKQNIMNKLVSQASTGIPEIRLPDQKGDTLSLSALKGKVVLLSFWTNNCPPCLMMNREYSNLYKKYSRAVFDVFQVSMDNNKDLWLSSLKEGEINWHSVREDAAAGSYYSGVYNITQLPTSFLIDREGTIIARDLVGKALEQKVAELIK
jgi:peroxiredoxin